MLILAPLALHCVPESPRWLLSTRQPARVSEARTILEEAATVNGRIIPDNDLIIRQAKREGLRKILTSKILFIRTLILSFNWFVVNFIFYGLVLNMEELTGSIYLNYIAMGCLQSASKLATCIIVQKAGRRITLMSLVLMAGTILLVTLAFPKGLYPNNWPIASLAVVGSLSITMALSVLQVYTAELYPTTIRNSGIGFCSSVSRVATIVSVSVGALSQKSQHAPHILFGALAYSAVFFTMFLPESGKNLPKSLDEIEERIRSGEDKNLFFDVMEAFSKDKKKDMEISKL